MVCSRSRVLSYFSWKLNKPTPVWIFTSPSLDRQKSDHHSAPHNRNPQNATPLKTIRLHNFSLQSGFVLRSLWVVTFSRRGRRATSALGKDDDLGSFRGGGLLLLGDWWRDFVCLPFGKFLALPSIPVGNRTEIPNDARIDLSFLTTFHKSKILS